MEHNRFIDELNLKLEKNEQLYKVHKAEFNETENSLYLTLLINSHHYDKYLDDALKARIYAFTKEILPTELKTIKLNFKKTITSEELVIRAIFEFIYQEFNLLTDKISKESIIVSIDNREVKLLLKIPQYIYNYCANNDFLTKLTDYLELEFIENIQIEIKIDNTGNEDLNIIEKKLKPVQNDLSLINITLKENIFSGIISKLPQCIEKAKERAAVGTVICGKIKYLTEKVAKASQKIFYTFKLDDTTASINVAVFPKSEKNFENMKALKDGDVIVIEGTVRYSDFDKENSIIANKLAYCEVDFNEIKAIRCSREANDDYYYVKPEAYIDNEQASIFEEYHESEFLSSKDFVVFDFETTGLHISEGAEPIELAAIKIKDGKMIESFSTFIKPKNEIPAQISTITNITDDDVAIAPSIENVMPDFFKFTRDSTLVAHNMPFDFGFIEKFGKELNYIFDNDCIDTIVLAKNKIRAKNYQLATLLEEFGIPIQRAHRAIYDAEATAKLFIKLVDMPDL